MVNIVENIEGENKNSYISSSTFLLKMTPNQDCNNCICLDVFYDSTLRKNYVKFYNLDTDTVFYYTQPEKFEPYFYTDTSYETLVNMSIDQDNTFIRAEEVNNILLHNDNKKLIKIVCKDYAAIYSKKGIRSQISGHMYETHVYPHLSYIYDMKIIPGLRYKIVDNQVIRNENLDQDDVAKILQVFKDEHETVKDFAKRNMSTFTEFLPKYKRIAYDIEVEETEINGFPDPLAANQKIISCAFKSSTGEQSVYLLNETGTRFEIDKSKIKYDIKIRQFKTERILMLAIFQKMNEYPIVIGFNSDNFDNMYLYNRAKKLGIPDSYIPFLLYRGRGINNEVNIEFKHGIHIDLFQLFSNRSLKVYAFGGKYLKNGLDDVSKETLKRGKLVHDGYVKDLELHDLINYNFNDADLTYDLTSYDNDFVMNLLTILMRITKLPFHELIRSQIAHWIKSYIWYEHREKGYVIPNKDELFQGYVEVSTYEGAIVVDPVPGIHFMIAVLDFASLYPTIIKTRNLSYETINCKHDDCKINMIPNTPYWVCTHKVGVTAYMVGFLRDIRVRWFKGLAKDKSAPEMKRILAKVIQSVIKVFINSAYGVFGDEDFPMFCLPVAESTTAVGRFSIMQTIAKALELGFKTLYGDTDSLMIPDPPDELLKKLQDYTENELEIELEKEKVFQMLALSDRKKNYIGIRVGGIDVDMKGVLGKKHNTPDFIKRRFKEFIDLYRNVTNIEQYKEVKFKSLKVVRETLKKIGKPVNDGGFPLEEYVINVALKKRLHNYVANVPQHVKAAKLLPPEEQEKLEPGSFISFIKTRDNIGAKPISLAKIEDINTDKYKEAVQSTFEQVLDAFQVSWEDVLGTKKLDAFFKVKTEAK